MSHCGQKIQCPSKCACGEEVKTEQEPQKPTSAPISAPVGDWGGGVGSWVVRRLLGPQIEETRGA